MLHDKAAFVTGGTSGIGQATARALAVAGCRVAIVGRNWQRGEALVANLRRKGAEAHFIRADLRLPDEIESAFDASIRVLGNIDIAFNNAGYVEPRELLGKKESAEFSKVFDINVRSVFILMQLQINCMLRSGGSIINNASVSGVRNSNQGLSLYSASKAALISLTKSAAMEYAGQGIRINSISPGRIDTPLLSVGGIGSADSIAATLPIARLGQPEEVASVVVWLASSASSFVVGHNLCVDGGYLSQ